MILSANMQGQTPFRGLHEVQPGEILRYSRTGLQKRRYWRLESRPHEDDLATSISTVRELLEDIVSRQLVSDVPLCMLLSGGLDSSVLTALAKRKVNGNGGLRSFSVDFTGHSESFQTDALRGTNDQPFVHQMVRHLGCEHQDIVLDTKQLCDSVTRKSVLNAWDLPNHIGDMDVSLYLLFEAIREHTTVAISGEAADEVFGGYPWAHDKAALEVPIYPWMAFQVSRGTPPPFSLFSPELIQKLNVWEYLGSTYADAIAEVPRLAGEEGFEARMREVGYLDMTRFLRGMLDRKDRTSMAVGLEVRVPFCDHRLVEYVFNAPWSMKSSEEREKSLLRAAAEDLLPEAVLQRPKSAFPATVDTRYDDMLCDELSRIVDGDGEAPVLPFIDVETTRNVVAGRDKAGGGTWGRLRAEGVVRTNAWLKEYELDMSDLL
jgi:asparagine synthase (glutamine-hydrolysing)